MLTFWRAIHVRFQALIIDAIFSNKWIEALPHSPSAI